MESWRVFSRGWKLAFSSLVPALVQALVVIIVGGMSLLPLAWLIARHAKQIAAVSFAREPPLVLLWRFSGLARSEWRAELLCFLLLSVWFLLLSIVYFYAEAGIVGTLIARTRIRGESLKENRQPGAWMVLKILWKKGLANGWRITKLAGAYAGVAFVPIVALEVLGWVCANLSMLHPRAALPAALVFLGGLIAVALFILLLLFQHGCAVVFTVREGLSVKRAASAAKGILKKRPLVFGGVLILRYGVNMAIGAVFDPLLIILLFALYFLRAPLMSIATALGVLTVLWLLVRSLVKVSVWGCYVAFCEERGG